MEEAFEIWDLRFEISAHGASVIGGGGARGATRLGTKGGKVAILSGEWGRFLYFLVWGSHVASARRRTRAGGMRNGEIRVMNQ